MHTFALKTMPAGVLHHTHKQRGQPIFRATHTAVIYSAEYKFYPYFL
jgi:hypothetical protein